MNLSYRPDSRLVVAKWEDHDGDRCYEERFVWNGKAFGRIARKALGAREACATD